MTQPADLTRTPGPTPGPAPGPATVGDYTLLTRIGEGGMGVVHLARKADGVRVALKVLRPHIVGDDEARRRLAREVSSLSRIRSRWVAEIVDADPWAPVPYVATRYVPGLSLHDHVQEEGPIEGRDLLWFAGCLAEGLASVHDVGVLHRDVKPSNVLMEGRTPILIDFGLARVADDPRLTHTGWLLGTPGYLAPEILYGEDATPACDVHSWAATVAFAATGVSPFGRGPSMAIMDRVRRGESDLSGLEGPLRDVLAAALAPEPEDRPDLQAILAWLRPQTTEPTAVLAAPPTQGSHGRPRLDTAFDDALALAAPTSAETRPRFYDDYAAPVAHADSVPTVVEPPTGTRVLPEMQRPATWRDSSPYGPTRVDPTWPPPAQHDPGAWAPFEEPAPAPVPLGERLRRGVLVLSGAAAVGAACAVAPWVSLSLIVVVVWLVRSGSMAASGVESRRLRRGRRWYDGVQLLLHTPWLLIASVPTTVMLLLWSAGLATAAGLVCYAVAAPLPLSLFLGGVALAVSLWWGPGGSRVRSPFHRIVAPLSSNVVVWLVAWGLLVGLTIGAGLWVESEGVSWTPAADRPFGL